MSVRLDNAWVDRHYRTAVLTMMAVALVLLAYIAWRV